jgi:hypothetical protein
VVDSNRLQLLKESRNDYYKIWQVNCDNKPQVWFRGDGVGVGVVCVREKNSAY